MAAVPLERGALEALARKELQALAKARGVKANQKSGAIVEELLELARGAAFAFVDEEEEEVPKAAGAARRRSSAPAPEAAASSSSSSSRRASCAARQSQGEGGAPAAAASRSARKSGASKSGTPAESAAVAASPVSRKRAAERDPSPAASSTKRRASRSATLKQQQQQQQGEQSRDAPAVYEAAPSGATPSRKRAAECEPEASVASPPPASAAKKRRLSVKEKENSLPQAAMSAYARTAAKVAPKTISQTMAKSAIKARFEQAHERLFQTQRSIADAKTPSVRLATQRKQRPTMAKTLARAATLNDKLAATVPAFAPSAPVLALADKKISVAAKTTVASESAKRAPAVTAPAEPKARPPRTKFNLADSLKRPITWKMKSGKLA